MAKRGAAAGPLLGVGKCLTETYEGAWRRGHESVGSQHILLSLVVRGDPISSSAFVHAGVGFSGLISLFPQASRMVDSSAEERGQISETEVEGVLRKAAAIPRPWFLLRLLTALIGDPIADHPRHPRPQWTANARAMLGSALDMAAVSGRAQPCRAELAVALLAQRDSAAVRILADLGVSSDDLRQEIVDRYQPDGPRPLHHFDMDQRAAAHVLRYLLTSDEEELPGHAESNFWSSGRHIATMFKIAALGIEQGVENPGEDHILLGILAAYEQMAVDNPQFGPGWEACFPAGRVLVESGLAFHPDGDPVSTEDEQSAPMIQTIYKLRHIVQSGFAELRQLLHPKDPQVSKLRTEALLLGVLQRENAAVDRLLADGGVTRDQLRHRLVAALTA